MKQCSECKVTMFDGAMECGVCNCSDLINLTPPKKVTKAKIVPTKQHMNMDLQKQQIANLVNINSDDVTYLDHKRYEVKSKSNPNITYIVDLNNMKDHKGKCLGYRYSQNCNHLEKLRQAGVAV